MRGTKARPYTVKRFNVYHAGQITNEGTSDGVHFILMRWVTKYPADANISLY